MSSKILDCLSENGDRLHPLPTGVPHQRLDYDGSQPVQESQTAESYQVIKYQDSDHSWLKTMMKLLILHEGKNLVSDGTFCTTFCPTQPKREISTHLHIMAILDIY